MAAISKANGRPTKAFFVRMITRDITLEDCILDLIDNSIDGAWRLEGGMPTDLSQGADLSKYNIEITANSQEFKIIDDCGGISLYDAENYAFTFGRRESDEFEDYSIGVYGIGMKRAVFKIGRDIAVHSFHMNKKVKEKFEVEIDVDEWLAPENENDWDFPILDSSERKTPGVNIVVKALNEGTVSSFRNPLFIQNLRRIISRDYSLHLHHGLNISLNKEPILGWNIEFKTSDDFAPIRLQYQEPEEGEASDDEEIVRVEIVAGMAAPPPDDSEPDEGDGEDRYGWYVVCNGRIVLAADKTIYSGWGTEGWPRWHGQYNGFIGFIFFNADDASLLPMTTTKRNVDLSSDVYRRALPRMREVTKTWTAYTNVRKQALDQAKKAESAAKSASIYSLPLRASVSVPKIVAKPKEKVANINYSVPLSRFRPLASALGNIKMGYRELGLKTFDLAYDDYVGEE